MKSETFVSCLLALTLLSNATPLPPAYQTCDFAVSSKLNVTDAACKLLCSQGRDSDDFNANCVLDYFAKSEDVNGIVENTPASNKCFSNYIYGYSQNLHSGNPPDIRGHDGTFSTNFLACQKECFNYPGCAAFQYNEFDDGSNALKGNCILKSEEAIRVAASLPVQTQQDVKYCHVAMGRLCETFAKDCKKCADDAYTCVYRSALHITGPAHCSQRVGTNECLKKTEITRPTTTPNFTPPPSSSTVSLELDCDSAVSTNEGVEDSQCVDFCKDRSSASQSVFRKSCQVNRASTETPKDKVTQKTEKEFHTDRQSSTKVSIQLTGNEVEKRTQVPKKTDAVDRNETDVSTKLTDNVSEESIKSSKQTDAVEEKATRTQGFESTKATKAQTETDGVEQNKTEVSIIPTKNLPELPTESPKQTNVVEEKASNTSDFEGTKSSEAKNETNAFEQVKTEVSIKPTENEPKRSTESPNQTDASKEKVSKTADSEVKSTESPKQTNATREKVSKTADFEDIKATESKKETNVEQSKIEVSIKTTTNELKEHTESPKQTDVVEEERSSNPDFEGTKANKKTDAVEDKTEVLTELAGDKLGESTIPPKEMDVTEKNVDRIEEFSKGTVVENDKKTATTNDDSNTEQANVSHKPTEEGLLDFKLETTKGASKTLHFEVTKDTEAHRDTDKDKQNTVEPNNTSSTLTVVTTTQDEDEEDDEEFTNPPPQRVIPTTTTTVPPTGSTSEEQSSNAATIAAASAGGAAAVAAAGAAYKFGGAAISAMSSTPDVPSFDVDVEAEAHVTDVEQHVDVSQSFFT